MLNKMRVRTVRQVKQQRPKNKKAAAGAGTQIKTRTKN